jgi:hypothetical protein
LKAPVLKTGRPARVSWVRIPPHPPLIAVSLLFCFVRVDAYWDFMPRCVPQLFEGNLELKRTAVDRASANGASAHESCPDAASTGYAGADNSCGAHEDGLERTNQNLSCSTVFVVTDVM